LRLQQYREMEEQRAAANRRNGGQSDMSSPWGYVAPSMPGLDVQQPVGGQGKKGPRPLQPPRTKRQGGDLASFMSDSSPPWASSSSERRGQIMVKSALLPTCQLCPSTMPSL
jgi:hypothetical protein